MFWRKKKSPDARVSEAVEFFNACLQTVVSCKEGFVRDGLEAEFKSVQHQGVVLLVTSSSLHMARSPADIPKLLETFASSVKSFVDACDKLAQHPASSGDVKTMVNALDRAVGNMVVVVQEEYK